METAIAALIILAVVFYGALTFVHDYLSAQDVIMESWREMEERLGERARTQISPEGAEMRGLLDNMVDVTLRNEGDTKLADFDQWDVIVQYDSDEGNVIKWLSYVEPNGYCAPGQDQWCEDIGDIFEPDIFNPGEVVTITLMVTPTVALTTTNRAIIATPNGITATAVFTR